MEKQIFEDLLQSVQEMDKIMRGEIPPSRVFVLEKNTIDARSTREKTGLSQSEFAKLLRVKIKTLQNWEERRSTPIGPAAALLQLVDKAPHWVLETLHSSEIPPHTHSGDIPLCANTTPSSQPQL